MLAQLNGDDARVEFRLPSVMEHWFPHAVRFAISVEWMQQNRCESGEGLMDDKLHRFYFDIYKMSKHSENKIPSSNTVFIVSFS